MNVNDMTQLMKIYDGLLKVEDGLDIITDGHGRDGALNEAFWIEDFIQKFSVFGEEEIDEFVDLIQDRKLSPRKRALKLLGMK
ncbi:MAG: hypothetical protein E7307_01415 [Butyrivibrio sp.]|nr:hypothetical protein [Butyrivibrio sp.]